MRDGSGKSGLMFSIARSQLDGFRDVREVAGRIVDTVDLKTDRLQLRFRQIRHGHPGSVAAERHGRRRPAEQAESGRRAAAVERIHGRVLVAGQERRDELIGRLPAEHRGERRAVDRVGGRRRTLSALNGARLVLRASIWMPVVMAGTMVTPVGGL